MTGGVPSVIRAEPGLYNGVHLTFNLLTAGLLYYLPGSTLAVAALFLIADVVDRWRVDDDAASPMRTMKRHSSMQSCCPPKASISTMMKSS